MNGGPAAPGRLRIAVYDRFWPTGGGGEKYAGGIAEVLAHTHDVTLIGHDPVDLAELGRRLQLDLSRVALRLVPLAPSAVEVASVDYDLLVNVSYGSVDRCAAPHGLYVSHFPVMPPFHPGRPRRLAISAIARLERCLGPVDAFWRRGAYVPEPVGRFTYRWTDGDAQLEIDAPEGTEVELVFVRMLPGGATSRRVDVSLGGRNLGSVELTPRRRRLEPRTRSVRFRMPAGGPGRRRIHVRSEAAIAGAGDPRVLGVALLAVLVGGRGARALRLASALVSQPAIDLSFLDTYSRVVANSEFTAGWIRRLWGRDAAVLYPPVSPQPWVPPDEKEQRILHVGRFFPPGTGHSKRQLELVGAFGSLVRSGRADGWGLDLVGGFDLANVGAAAYVDQVRGAAAGLPVTVHTNASSDVLRDLYRRAALYWHATGLGEDPEIDPDRFEHFGISTVEAMSAGAVPIVIAVAGQIEAVTAGTSGEHFHDVDELVERTAAVIADPERRAHLATGATARAAFFGPGPFADRLEALVAEARAAAPGRLSQPEAP